MKTIKYILLSILIGSWGACDDSIKGLEGEVACTDITDLSATSGEGQIMLEWNYPEGENTIRYLEVRYFDPAKMTDVKKTVSVYADSILIADTRKKYGEYVFQVQPFSESCSPGNIHEIRAESLAAPVVYEFSSTEMNLTANDIYVEGIRDSEPQNLLDGDTETFVNTDYSQPAGTVFWIDFTLPKEQEFLKFSYINRNHSAASFPSEIECYVKANENDEWTLIKTLTTENDALPTDPLGRFTSSEYQAPFEFNYFRFRVPRTHTGNPNFSLAEFRVFDVSYTFVDPEAE